MLGYGSAAANDQLFPVAPDQAFHPLVFGNVAEDMWPAVGTFQIPPVPGPFTDFGNVPVMGSVTGSYGSASSPGTIPSNTSETGNPYHLTKSPLWWVLGFLALSLFILHKVFWKGG